MIFSFYISATSETIEDTSFRIFAESTVLYDLELLLCTVCENFASNFKSQVNCSGKNYPSKCIFIVFLTVIYSLWKLLDNISKVAGVAVV